MGIDRRAGWKVYFVVGILDTPVLSGEMSFSLVFEVGLMAMYARFLLLMVRVLHSDLLTTMRYHRVSVVARV